MTKIIAVRHGQTELNKRDMVIGFTDSPLTREGKQQIEKVALALKDESIDSIFCSDLERCIKTAEAINKYHNARISYTKILRERDYGIFDGRPISAIAKERKRKKMPRYKFRPQKGESYEDLKIRIEPFIEKLIGEDKTFLLVTHGDVIRIISRILLNKPVQNLARMRFRCASINIFEQKDGKFVLKKLTKHLN